MNLTNIQMHKGNRAIKIFFLPVLLMLLISCGSGKKSAFTQINDYQELREAVYNGEFEIENQWAYPVSGSMIDLLSNPNYLRMKNDSVDLFLPYFGVRHMGGDYGGREGGIKYKGVAEDLEIDEANDESKIEITFEAEEGTENYNFRITLFPNGNASTHVTSSERNSISYRGIVKGKSTGTEEER
ncbi:protein of unknown function [Salinimicrobium catena]|uniref:DUF4251 domain-containing protein n=1 Tax=Salinimicrobium catena TaxID=390640 RepID=A0A1H5LRU7_9FLAO|nr:DUF4251 domain-containing protein [Salinimicrobium catena]SDL13411.1 protein of unknown function [Salinimicrobium catena]SEE79749.1 protein of unknown function [Salinimicrobium catena]